MTQPGSCSGRLLCRPVAYLATLVLAATALSGCAGLFSAQPTPPPVVVIVTAAPTVGPAATAPPAPTPPTRQNVTPEPTALLGSPIPVTPVLPTAESEAFGVLQRVRNRGRLICGANADLPGFGFYDNVRNRWSGFDVDFCRVVAAAVLGDAAAVEFVGLTTTGPNERFQAIREGRVDVLFRNTTWTLQRDTADIAFGPTTFHDGQTFMARKSAGITSLQDLRGKKICVSRGTTSELNLNDDFGSRGIPFTPVLFDDESQLYPSYDAGACDAVTSDSSQLASKRETLENPDDHIILGDRISREPLGPAFITGDDIWRDVVTWAVFATMYAEELRVTQANVDDLREASNDPRVRRLLGLQDNLGEGLGLRNDFAYQIIRQVGNYADIYERNLGPDTPFALDRGPNKAWNLGQGGVLASPPFR